MGQADVFVRPAKSGSKTKFFIGGLMIVAAVVYLIFSSLQSSSQYFLTVEELNARNDIVGRDVRISGAVIGDSIQYDPDTLTLRFTIAHTPGDQKEVDAQGGLAMVLHQAVTNPNSAKLNVVYNGVMPDLLRDEAQAIMTGKVDEQGVFHAEELLLKCPTKYEEAVPAQAGTN